MGILLPVEDEREGDLYLARAWRIDGWGCFRERRGDRTIKKEDEREREREWAFGSSLFVKNLTVQVCTIGKLQLSL